MPSRTQRILAAVAAFTGTLPLGATAALLLVDGDPWAAAFAAAALLVAVPLAIRPVGWFRATCLAVGLPLLAVSTAGAGFGGALGWPASLSLVAAGVIPRTWPVWKGLLAPFGIFAALFALLGGGYLAYSCLRPVPILVVDGSVPQEEVDAATPAERVNAYQLTGDGYEWEFDRGAGDARDAAAARLRDRLGARSVRTRDERCD